MKFPFASTGICSTRQLGISGKIIVLQTIRNHETVSLFDNGSRFFGDFLRDFTPIKIVPPLEFAIPEISDEKNCAVLSSNDEMTFAGRYSNDNEALTLNRKASSNPCSVAEII